MRHFQSGETVARQVRDRRLVASPLKDAELRESALQEVYVEARLNVRVNRPKRVKVVLERHSFDLAVPNSSAPNFAALAHEEIAWTKALLSQFIGRDRHLVDLRKVDVVPEDVGRSQEGGLLRAVTCRRRHGLSRADVE